MQLELDPESAERFSDGAIDLVMRFKDGEYEDLIPIRIPVRLPGWKQQADFSVGANTYSTQSIATASPNVAWAVANINDDRPGFTRTIDGRTWQSIRNIAATSEQVYCVAAFNDKLAWAGSGPANSQAGIYRTVNGGTSWTRTSVSAITPFVDAIHFFDSSNGIFLGDPLNGRWGIGTTTDGGATWRGLATPVAAGAGEAGWNNSFAAHGDNLWFGTNNNRSFRSTDRGRTWAASSTPSVNSFSFAFTSPLEGVAVFKRTIVNSSWVGANMIAVTRNGGSSWQAVTLPFGANADAVAAIPEAARIVVTTESGILETTDLGQTWMVVPAPASVFNWKSTELGARVSPSVNVSVATSNGIVGGYGVNSNGRIIGFRESPPAAAPIENERARIATLLGPYPNPTNGTSTLVFELATSEDVNLTLVDAQGSTVRTLLAERRESGRHAIVIDGATLAAGSYHAVLTVADQRVTRAVVIVK
ncbi:MAG: T9SS type A sorting domain-containing protein [bacterium]|nr:T9SS type A sorting domain-containing protein [Candidatus Kapabacteria bacterium]